MNTVQGSYEKRSIKVKDFLEDFHSGADDAELMEKYRLTAAGMERFYTLLEERGILTPEDFAARIVDEHESDGADPLEENHQPSFICPACHSSQEAMVDSCPECGASAQETMKSQMEPDLSYREEELATDFDPVPETPFEHFEAKSDSEEAELAEVGPVSEAYALPETTERHRSGDVFGATKEWDTSGESAYLERLESDEESYEMGMPFADSPHGDLLRYDEDVESGSPYAGLECEKCEGILESSSRDIFDKTRAYQALKISGVMFALSFLAAAALHFFEGYSFARLLVVYSTGLFLMGGAVFLTVGALMVLAREKIFQCTDCWRVYPRA
jgi:hypothetical protein